MPGPRPSARQVVDERLVGGEGDDDLVVLEADRSFGRLDAGASPGGRLAFLRHGGAV